MDLGFLSVLILTFDLDRKGKNSTQEGKKFNIDWPSRSPFDDSDVKNSTLKRAD